MAKKIELGRILTGCNHTRVAQFCVISTSLRGTQNISIHSYRFLRETHAFRIRRCFGAIVYMHSVKEDGTTTTKLISSKSRVTPIKVISIPCLELSACLLLAQLMGKVRLSLQVHLAKVILHTDSTIAIAWINTPANQPKTFVSNRVSKIQTLTENFEWKHIPSAQNPADIISRGVNPE
ncbi:integrase catalytic domain-containing protein [Trichonephila clavipes]|nr:integrase catalytic domain-containing protein [Trichonephila clavipes]